MLTNLCPLFDSISNKCALQAKACQLKMHIDIAKDGDCKDEPIKGRSGNTPEHEEKLDFTDDETDNQDDVEDTKEVSTEEAATVKEAPISENNDDEEDATKDCNSEKCPDEENLVCGSDNITYKNKCILEKNNCNNGMNVEVTSDGKCVVEESDDTKVKSKPEHFVSNSVKSLSPSSSIFL